jgi:hypothetical protein
MTHYLSIVDGQIHMRLAGDPDTVFHKFEDEGEAVDCLAARMVLIPDARMLTSSSCNFPDEDGRPNFDATAFFRRVRIRASALERGYK